MRLITNADSKKRSHLHELRALIKNSDEIVLSSGWMKECGLGLIVEEIRGAIGRGASVTIYSSQRETQPECFETLAGISGVRHFTIGQIYFHPKLYYGKAAESFVAILGSANITKGGLQTNEELSCLMEGTVNEESHVEIRGYLNRLLALEVFHAEPVGEAQRKKLVFKAAYKLA